MAASNKLRLVILVLLIPYGLLAQNSGRDISSDRNSRPVITGDNGITASADYRIISSGASYLEIELYPQYGNPTEFTYANEKLTQIEFAGSVREGDGMRGKPDIAFRVLPVILPSEKNNSISVIDYDVKEVRDVNLSPVPEVKIKDDGRKGIIYEYSYARDSKAYSENRFLPENIAVLKGIGSCRELITGQLVIFPYSYNPVSRTLKQYTRIRVRVNFGQAPVMLNRKRSNAELELLNGIAVNSKTALNWMNPGLSGKRMLKLPGNSHMSTGDWYRIEIQDNGSGNSDAIYKMNKSFLESAGINFNNVDPRTIKMYGNGGYMLPEGIYAPRQEDLTEISIYIEGENDGHFDANDYVLFYGNAINNWNYDLTYGYSHYINIYSRSNYYWICINTPGNGKRMVLRPSENIPNPVVPQSFTEKLFYEPEINNLINEGNLWLSEKITNGESFVWNNTLTGLLPGSNILYKIKPASRVFFGYENHMLLQEVNSVVSPITYPMGNVSAEGYGDWIWTDHTQFTINASMKNPPNSETSSFTAAFYTSQPTGEGYLDWMEIQYKRRFNSAVNDFIRFDSPPDSGALEYNVSNFSNNSVRIFDVTRHDSVSMVDPLTNSGGSVKFQKSSLPNNLLSKFFVVGQNGYRTPSSISQRFPNQNLHNGYSDGADFIIITHSDFLPAANRLKAKREQGGPGSPDYLKTYVFDVQSIYNEFSGGVLDPVAIRDFLKYCYDNWQIRPSYVCLLGDGSFDYKQIFGFFSNWVPAFEYTSPTINQVANYCTDDFFVEVSGDDQKIDMAIGRIPVNGLDEANGYLDKVDCYENPSYNEYWKNRIGYVADDGDGALHVIQAETIAEYYTPGTFDKLKMYLPSYPTIITPQGRRKPGVNADIVKYWNEGLLGLHYAGHGSPEQWAVEAVLEKDVVIAQLNNICRYPFVVVASCDFSKFDNPLEICGGELLAITPRKGAIGTLGATRPTDGLSNSALATKFWQYILNNSDTLINPWRFSKAVFAVKQEIFSINEQKYVLLCDPSIRVRRPRFVSRIDSITGLSGDTMRALSRIKIFGSILKADSSFWGDYNGTVRMKVFDVPKNIEIIDETGTYHYRLQGGIIFSGSQRVNNGRFTIQYIVPKDISYLNQHGKIIDYFFNSSYDGSGLDSMFIVGGIDPTAPVDTTGPDITLYINSKSFRNGDVVNENFKLMGDLYDESGINTSGTIGHKLEAILDNNYNNKYDLTNFYNSDTTYRSGHFDYDMNGISEGHHTIKVKAWDTYNNSSEETIDFIVSTYTALRISNIYNYPNPFKDRTAFTFQHNYPGSINVDIKVYTVSGRLIKEVKSNGISDKFVAIDWDGKDADGETLANGIYLYKVMVTADDGNSQTSIGKMAVLR